MLLDAIEPIELGDVEADRASNAIGALHRLAAGLGFLYGKVRVAELNLAAKLAAELPAQTELFVFGDHPRLNQVRQDLIECAFQWYAVSLANFVHAVASLAHPNDSDQRKAYEARVLGPVRAFRDKIAAHFAGMTANKDDKDAERFASLIPQVAWKSDRFEVASFCFRQKIGAQESDSSEIAPWMLTELHEDRARRYPMLREATPTFDRQTDDSSA